MDCFLRIHKRIFMQLVKSTYRLLFPLSWRKSIWKVYWLLVSLKADYSPKLLFLQDYEEYWDSRDENNIWGLSYQDLIALCIAEIHDNDRILDFGCGAGNLLCELSRVRQINGVGLDTSERAVKIAKENGVNANVFRLEDTDGLMQFGRFDLAITTEVLEHVQQAEMVLIALSKVSDRVLVSIPNTGYFGYRLRLLAGRFPRQWIIHPAEHVRFWTCADFNFTAKITGYEIKRVCGIAGGRLGRWWPSIFAPDLFFVLEPSVKSGETKTT
jgi:methionine biosynthesis protein MetW